MTLASVQSRIDAALAAAGRSAGAARLIAVSKQQPLDRVEAALIAGHRLFGENRVQEAAGKWPDLRTRYSGVELHLLGPLQSNKVNQALGLFDAIQSLDRPSLAQKLASAVQKRGHCPMLFVQVNTGEEPQKSGVIPDNADAFIQQCRSMDLTISGLMVIPPLDEEPTLHFALLAKIAERNGIGELSMGMSADFETAARMGATYVRVGSAIFGDRAQS
ncbi:YggS family pyridoxal phosphate-dependent enzyme [Pikeienuella piscinae]|uniref:Pyridoxal phosphate homeostasis protein n=1 Tax=Pikeienuella piscinae TaxID=2748098 RepID=A0A7L5C307_9RHOB|nr:YggS family pyridoxal phosphate-dependent enzyme [Pikeienuella piscinae]QIE56279.1 YggS family pyridoxal phosphate-dependent enzyme [Pikeienuella piscinae]